MMETMAKKRRSRKAQNRIVEFKEEFENLIKKYKIIPDPIIGFDLIAFMANCSDRQIRRIAKEDPDFPDIYELSYHIKGCKLSEVEKWVELYNTALSNNKTLPTINASHPLPAHQ